MFLPESRMLVLEIDEGGNERTQLYVLDDRSLEPLVVDPRYNHWTPLFSRDGALLAYSTNRRNGRDFDMVARDLASGEERVFELGGYVGVDVDLARRPVHRRGAGRRARRRLRPLPLDLETGDVEHVTPHEGAAEYGSPVLARRLVGLPRRRRTRAGTPSRSLASRSAAAGRSCSSRSGISMSRETTPAAALLVVRTRTATRA